MIIHETHITYPRSHLYWLPIALALVVVMAAVMVGM